MTEIDAGAIRGITPPMTTPFTETGAIDEAAFRAETRFLLDAGVHGLAVGVNTEVNFPRSAEVIFPSRGGW